MMVSLIVWYTVHERALYFKTIFFLVNFSTFFEKKQCHRRLWYTQDMFLSIIQPFFFPQWDRNVLFVKNNFFWFIRCF